MERMSPGRRRRLVRSALLHHKLGELRSGSNPKQVAFSLDRRSFRVRRQLATRGNWSKVMALSPAYQRLAAGGGGRAAAHRAELAKR